MGDLRFSISIGDLRLLRTIYDLADKTALLLLKMIKLDS